MSADAGTALSVNALVFAHLSDLHLPFTPRLGFRQRFSKRQLSVWSWHRRRKIQSPQVLEALRGDLARHLPDHVVVTGDITNFSLPQEFARATDWLATLCPQGGLSLVPGNHDTLVKVDAAEGLGRWTAWTGGQWPYVHRRGDVSFIGLKSALPTAPLLATGRIGAEQLGRLRAVLRAERAAGQLRVLLLHHPVVDGAVYWRKALTDRRALRQILCEEGAGLVLHGHAHNARLDALAGPDGPIPCLCVPSSSALPNPRDETARWHLLRLPAAGRSAWAEVTVRQWSTASGGFVDVARYELQLRA